MGIAYSLFNSVGEPPVVDDSKDGGRRIRYVPESIHQNEIEDDVEKGQRFDTAVFQLFDHFVALAAVLNELDHSIICQRHLTQLIVLKILITITYKALPKMVH